MKKIWNRKMIENVKDDFVFGVNLFPKGLEVIVGEEGSQLLGG